MNNIISADFFRLRRGAALRNTLIGVAIFIIFIAVMFFFSQSEGFNDLMMDSAEGISAAEAAQMEQDLQELQEGSSVNNGADFAAEMLAQSIIFLAFLPIALAIFCADFSAGTYRNTLSYESNRKRVYLSKLLLSAGLCILIALAMVLFSCLVGGIFFGFAGFTGQFFAHTLTTFVLQLPLFLAAVAVCHFLIAFTQKSSTTITIFLVGFMAITVILQVLATSVPGMDWLMLFDPQSGGKIMAYREMASTADMVIVAGYNIAVAVAATVLGLVRYRKVDMP
ncbi:MAG: hypothetical protein ACK5LX_13060 [Oscillospiraceae bacterium]